MKTLIKRLIIFTVLGWLVLPGVVAQYNPMNPPPKDPPWQATLVAEGISHPWGMAWLPGGGLLVTSRDGTLNRLNGNQFEAVPLDGFPEPFVSGEAGLLDIALHPGDQDGSIRVYMTMCLGTEEKNRIALVRGIYDGSRVTGGQVLFKARPVKGGSAHNGSRLLWLPDGTLLMSVGDGGNPPVMIDGVLAREQAQNPSNHLGKILRLTEDGAPPPDNPFIGQAGVRPEIYTLGHRNVQGLTIDTAGRIWATEHGPSGGDELNVVRAGKNYGWPLQSWGFDARGDPVGQHVVPGMKNSKFHWTPSIAPSGMTVYTGDDFPAWQGDLFVAGLVSETLRRIALDPEGKIRFDRPFPFGARVRDVQQGPDGKLYVITDEDNGKLYRIDPAP